MIIRLDCQDLYPLMSLSITEDETSSHCGPEMWRNVTNVTYSFTYKVLLQKKQKPWT